MKYKIYSVEFERENQISCPLCKSTFILDNFNKILKCSNDICEFNTLKHLRKKKLVLTNEEYKKYTKEITVSNLTISYWLKRGFTEAESKLKIANIQSARGIKGNQVLTKKQLRPSKDKILKKMLLNYSFEEARKMTEKIWSDWHKGITKRYYRELGLNEEEINEKISNRAKNANKILQIKKNKNPEKYANIFQTQLGYWIKLGLSQEDAKKALKERQTTFSLKKCIQKYGEIEGTKKWQQRQEKWKTKIFNKYGTIASGQSNISNEFIKKLLNELPEEIRLKCKYGKNEKYIKNKETKKAFKYDFVVDKLIIEFNGDYWHANPKIYKENEKISYPGSIRIVNEIWEHDNEKINCAKQAGYEVIIIWENEYKNNKDNILKNLKNKIININKGNKSGY